MAIENHELVALIKKRQGDTSLRTFAPTLGVTAAYLSDVYNGNRPVGPRLCAAMGYARTRTVRTQFKRKNGAAK